MQVWFQKEYIVCILIFFFMPQKILQAKLNLMVSHIGQLCHRLITSVK